MKCTVEKRKSINASSFEYILKIKQKVEFHFYQFILLLEVLTKSGPGSGWGHDWLRSKSRLWPLCEARPGADLCNGYLLLQQAYFDTAFQRLIED
jgi:hypothetical protein